MKRLLIISPYFPPSNAADMQRVRMSLPFFEANGWIPEVIMVHERYSETSMDQLLVETIPGHIKIHKIKAFPKKWTGKLGLGSLALRALWYFLQKGNELLKMGKFDLVYFSTSQFPVCILGAYWKKKFGIPYVIDLQDPWHTTYYLDKPKQQRPKKYWFSYRLNKYLEPVAMNSVDGVISVSQTYLDDLGDRYPHLKNIPQKVITFGYSDIDLQLSSTIKETQPLQSAFRLSYIGVLGVMMHKSLTLFFNSVKEIKDFQTEFFILLKGTSYASNGKKTALPLAAAHGIKNISEDTRRLGMLAVLAHLQQTDGLLIFGTDDPGYTASKLYPYLQSEKPILAILHPNSNAYQTLKNLSSAIVISLEEEEDVVLQQITSFLAQVSSRQKLVLDKLQFKSFSAQHLTKSQCELFETVLRSRCTTELTKI